jgi:hypothetical protein
VCISIIGLLLPLASLAQDLVPMLATRYCQPEVFEKLTGELSAGSNRPIAASASALLGIVLAISMI